MDIARVDSSATLGDSALHRVAPGAKLISFALVLAAVVASTNVLVVTAVLAALMATVIALRLPWRSMFAFAAYPGLFAAVYAFATASGMLATSLIVAKAVSAALAAVILMFTTPYPQVFAPVQRVVPGIVGDALLMTYRSLFLLVEKLAHTITAARLRAGIVGASPVRSAATMTRSLGGVLLYSIDLSQRTRDVMQLRGYDGRLAVTPLPSRSRVLDAATVGAAAALAGVALAWRIGWRELNAYSWLPLAAATLVLCVVTAARALGKGSA